MTIPTWVPERLQEAREQGGKRVDVGRWGDRKLESLRKVPIAMSKVR